MAGEQALVNQDGDLWLVEHRESVRLKHIDGFLMTCDNLSRIVMSAQVTEREKARGRETLLNRLTQMPIGMNSTILWISTDEQDTRLAE